MAFEVFHSSTGWLETISHSKIQGKCISIFIQQVFSWTVCSATCGVISAQPQGESYKGMGARWGSRFLYKNSWLTACLFPFTVRMNIFVMSAREPEPRGWRRVWGGEKKWRTAACLPASHSPALSGHRSFSLSQPEAFFAIRRQRRQSWIFRGAISTHQKNPQKNPQKNSN